jgi:hypothetical protein
VVYRLLNNPKRSTRGGVAGRFRSLERFERLELF